MGYDEGRAAVSRPHGIVMEERSRLSVSGVEDVLSFDEQEASMQTSRGLLTVRGSELKVGRLSLETGDVSIEGLVTELIYEETAPSGSLWTRLFG